MNYETVAAVYVFCADYHTGLASREYRVMSRIARLYNPRLSDTDWWAARNHETYKALKGARL